MQIDSSATCIIMVFFNPLFMQINSRGWFEDDESFSERLEISNAAWSTTNKQNSKRSKKPATSSSSTAPSNSTWVTSMSTRPKSKAKGPSGVKKNKGGKGGGGVFAAMMLDSDSD